MWGGRETVSSRSGYFVSPGSVSRSWGGPDPPFAEMPLLCMHCYAWGVHVFSTAGSPLLGPQNIFEPVSPPKLQPWGGLHMTAGLLLPSKHAKAVKEEIGGKQWAVDSYHIQGGALNISDWLMCIYSLLTWVKDLEVTLAASCGNLGAFSC